MRGLRLAITLAVQGLLLSVPAAIGAWSEAGLDPAAAPIVLESSSSQRISVPREWTGSGFEPQLVFYPQGACDSELVEIEIWDRIAEEWRPHDRHPRLHTDSCAVEDAGVLLNEIRVRCIDPSARRRPSGWRIGADVWYPRAEEKCALLDGGRPRPLEIAITSPGAGELVIAEGGFTSIRGVILSAGLQDAKSTPVSSRANATPRDIVVALDASATGDFEVDPHERGTLLEAQRDAVRSMLNALAPRLDPVRIGLVSHAANAARVEIPLTDDLGALHAALDAIRVRAPNTDPSYSAALALATSELDDRDGSPDAGRGGREKFAYLLFNTESPFSSEAGTSIDGSVSSNAGLGSARDWARRVEAAHNARRAGIALHVLALKGPASGPRTRATPRSIARSWPALYAIPSSFTPVEAPSASADWLERVTLARVTRVRIDNLTTREVAPDIALFPSGAFAGEVPVDTGQNHLRITALSSDGRTGTVDLEIEFRPPSETERALAAERERMQRVREARRKSLEMTVEDR